MCYRVEWAKFQERERKKEEEEKEKERVAYAQIDWHDFVVVETVDFQPNEQGRSVTPVSGARSLAPSPWGSVPSCPRGAGGSCGGFCLLPVSRRLRFSRCPSYTQFNRYHCARPWVGLWRWERDQVAPALRADRLGRAARRASDGSVCGALP